MEEFDILDKYVKEYWSMATCKQFYLSVPTTSVESFFATRLFHLPKNVFFSRNYAAKTFCCAMQWNANHISKNYKRKNDIKQRQNWEKNVHRKVFDLYQPQTYNERRGRKRKLIGITNNRKSISLI